MRILLAVSFVLLCFLSVDAQNARENVEGNVSFITSQNVYIKYSSTKGIVVGDTLFAKNNNALVPALVVYSMSSTSVVCNLLSNIKVNINDAITAKRRVENKEPEKIKPIETQNNLTADTSAVMNKKEQKSQNPSRKQKIYGFVSLSNYSNFSNTPYPFSYRNNVSVSFNIKNIANSKFSLETNLLYRQGNGDWTKTKGTVFNALKIYNFAVKYDITKSLFLLLGRKANPNVANIGAIDGLQVEKSFKGFYLGGFGGARPGYMDYGFNFNLLQYGAYVGYNMQTPKRNMQNSLAFVQQMNNLKTDRRFLYFQHSSSLLKNVNMFVSIEMDLYKVVNQQKQNTFNLTNLYASLRWRPVKRLTLTGSYDARTNVIYYETDKNYINTLLDMQTRQGLGFFANLTLAKYLYMGARVGYRFQNNDLRQSKNAYLFITYSNIAKSKISSTLSSTILQSSYLQGNIYNLRLSRPFVSGKMNIGLAYSYVNYKIMHAETPFIQHIAEFNFTVEIIKKLSLALNVETDIEKTNQFYRAYIQLRKRF